MPEYTINDDWVLQRVQKESNSFSDWIKDIVSSAQKKAEELDNPEVTQQLKEAEKDLPELVDLDRQIQTAKDQLKMATKAIPGLGSIGSFVNNLTTSIQEKISQQIPQKLEGLSDIQFNLDFLTGKKKSLSAALYDVAKERGIDSEGILYLIKSLPDLESFLYYTSAGKFYRDHTEHQLRVAVLGDFLLEQDLGNGTLLGIIEEKTNLDKQQIKDKIWWITGLIHDIGYPLQKMTKSINYALLNQILKCYPLLDLEVSPMELNLSSKDQKIEDYLTIIEEGLTKKARELIRQGAGLDIATFPQPKIEYFQSNAAGHKEYNFNSQIQLDHGVIGALSLLKSLGTPEHINSNKDFYEGYILAAQAIAIHNFKNRLPDFVFNQHPLAFLLVLVDEMQEWGRPIPIQVGNSYFTTELRKISLLDQIHLTLDEVEWLMAYKNIEAKELMDFDFSLICQGKNRGFSRLDRGGAFPETRIILQNFDAFIEKDGTTAESNEKELKTIKKHLESKAQKKHRKKKKTPAELEELSKLIQNSQNNVAKKSPQKQLKLISEFNIVI